MAMVKDCILIDDDQDDQEIFLMALKDADTKIKCLTANDGVDGVKMLSDPSCAPRYIFIDINMPKMNGIECLRHIKKFDHIGSSRIIMYSTSVNKGMINQCKELGADEFLVKPTAFAPLVAALTNIFKR